MIQKSGLPKTHHYAGFLQIGSQIFKQLEEEVNEEVDMRMSNMKPLTAQWMMDLHRYLASRPSIIINGFKAAGIKNCH